MTLYFRTAVVGVAMGITLSRAGFSDFTEVHEMFTFADPRLLLVFVGSVAVAAIGFALTRSDAPSRPIHRGVVPGGIMFGIGWAITGACPSIALVQIGEGKILALLTAGGIALGTWAYGGIHKRFFNWDAASCGDW